MHSGSNELSPSLISSPHPSVHPAFQRYRLVLQQVLPSTFNLTKGRSSESQGLLLPTRRLSRLLSLRLQYPRCLTYGKSNCRFMQRHAVTAYSPTVCGRTVSGTISPLRLEVLFTFPSTVLVPSRSLGYCYTGWSRQIHA